VPDSIPSPTPWLVDPDLVHAMRRDHAEAALKSGQLDRALVEAEELLSERPHDAHALWITARAALSMGDACTAERALDQLLERSEDDRPVPAPVLHAEMAFARFLQAEFGAARTSAATALALDRTLPSAWVFLGLAEERLGRPDEATEAYERAESIEAGSAPRRLPSPPLATWVRMLETAKQHLPDDQAAVLSNLDVIWQDLPDPTVLKSVEPAISPFIEALISGDDPLDEPLDPDIDPLDAALQQAVPSPSVLTVYTANLLRGQPSTADIVDRLAKALRAELAAWLGIAARELIPEVD